MKIDSPTFLSETTFISASVQFSSGSQKFGNTTDDQHQFTGSLKIGGNSFFREIGSAHQVYIDSDAGGVSQIGTNTYTPLSIRANGNQAIYISQGAVVTMGTTNVGNLTSTGTIVSTGANGLISGSSTSTGSFGNVYVANEIEISDSNTRILEGSNNVVKLQSNSGYIEIGAMNGSYAHFVTDRSQFYFNKKLIVDEGIVQSYDENLILRRTTNSANKITIADGATHIGETGGTHHLVVNGNVSGSASSTGSFGKLLGDGSQLTGISTGGLGNIVEDTTPQLGGDLDLNSNDITGTGNISITGGITLAGGGPNINGSGGNVYMLPTNFIVRSTISNDSGDVTVGDNLTVTGNVSGSATSTGSFGQGFFGSHVGIQTAPGSNELTVGGAGFVRAEYFRGTKFYHHSSNAGMGVGSNLIYFDDNNLNRVFQIKRDGGVHISGSHASTGSFGKLVIPQQGNNVAIEALGGNFSVANTIFQHTANAGNTQLGSSVASFNHSSGKVYTRKDGGYGDGGNEAFKATDHPVGAGFWVDSGGSMQFGHDDGSGARNTVQMMTLGPQDGHASGSLLVSGSIIAAEGDISGSATSTGSFGRIILPSGALADKSAPQLAFGDGNTGFFENGDNGLSIAIAGNRRWYFAADTIFGNDSGGPALFAKTATATQPVYSFEGDANTGIGKASADNMSLIAAGVEQLRIASNTISGSAASTGSFGSVFLGNIGNDKTLSIGDSSRGNHKIYDNSGYLRFDSSIWLGNGYIYVGGTFNLDAGANDIRFGSSSGGANTIHFKTDGSTDGITITQNHITSSGNFSS